MLLLLLACVDAPGPASSRVIDALPEREQPDLVQDIVWPDNGETVEPPDGDDAPLLLINEVMTNNGSCYLDEVGVVDWVEILHPGTTVEPIALNRISLHDSSGLVWMGSADATLEPGGHLLVYADGTASGGLHTPFKLDSDGDTVTLMVDGVPVDRISTGALPTDVAWARFPDGGDWGLTVLSTPGDTNGDTPSETLDPLEGFYGLSQLHSVVFTLDEASYQTLYTNGRTYVTAMAEIDGVGFDPVGIRLRGSMTYQPLSGKAAFKLDMNHYADYRYRGQEKFNILNMYYEASFSREYLAYKIFRDFGVPAARNAYTQVWLNEDYYGLYMISECYDDEFLRNWYGDQEGFMLWEPGSGDFSGSMGWWECEEGPCDTSVVAPIGDLLNKPSTDENIAEMETYLDLDNALRMIAIELVVGQWDGYCAVHNYRVAYNPATGLSQLIPSSLDLTFDNLYDYGTNFYSCNGQLLNFCLDNEACAERYDNILLELADAIENDMDLMTTMDTMYTIIEPLASEETRGQYNYAKFIEQFDYVRSYIEGLPEEIRIQVERR